MGAGGGADKNPVKVVIINTQYIETDALSFKSVVQRLTGKDSTVAAAASHGQPRLQPRNEGSAHNNNIGPVLGRGISFEEFDRKLGELPRLDELYSILY